MSDQTIILRQELFYRLSTGVQQARENAHRITTDEHSDRQDIIQAMRAEEQAERIFRSHINE